MSGLTAQTRNPVVAGLSPKFKSWGTLVNGQLVCLQPVKIFNILNNVSFNNFEILFQLFARLN